MRIILLPGMDGTGILFRPFVQELRKGLPEEVSVQVLSYPADQVLSYGQLIEDVARRLPAQEEIILLAESFSGPIAYALASRQPNRIRALIFVVTFLRPPRGLIWQLPRA